MIFENLILEVKIFGSKIISILLNDIENFQKSSHVYKKNQCYLAKWKLFSTRKCLLQELNFQKSKTFDGIFKKKVDLGSKASDYQEKLYGTRREAEKSTK